MTDVRALLKAKRQESHIAHPFATYTPSGQLKCVVCGTVIKHASAWQGHLGSKLHRTNVTRSREEKAEETWQKTGERESLSGKRKAETNESDRQTDKKRRIGDTEGHSTLGLPNDFFSDPSHVPVISEFPSADSDDDANDINLANITTLQSQSQPLQVSSTSVLDQEYDLFQRGFLEGTSDRSQTYDQATIIAEPVLAALDVHGFPTTTAALTQNEDDRVTRDYEERELIMDRLLDEERAQEDADMRVHLMKNRLESLRKRREAIKALKVNVAGK